jgi:hypothetical protein
MGHKIALKVKFAFANIKRRNKNIQLKFNTKVSQGSSMIQPGAVTCQHLLKQVLKTCW